MREPEDDDQASGVAYLKTTMKYLFTHVGLFLLVCLYCVGGAFLFMHIEGTDEEKNLEQGMNRSQQIEMDRQRLVNDLWMHKWSSKFNRTVEFLLEDYHHNVTRAIELFSYKGMRINHSSELEYGWSFPSALLFTVTIVTTIGYGHVAPASELGQIVVILYSLLGIPLMLMFLANIGDAMANFFRMAYGRGCCYFCYRQRHKNYELNRKRQKRIPANPDRPKSAWDDKQGRDFSADGTRKRKLSQDRKADNDSDLEDNIGIIHKLRDGPTEDQQNQSYEDQQFINVPISLTLVIIAAYIFIGAVLFAAWNEWSWITGAYFSLLWQRLVVFCVLLKREKETMGDKEEQARDQSCFVPAPLVYPENLSDSDEDEEDEEEEKQEIDFEPTPAKKEKKEKSDEEKTPEKEKAPEKEKSQEKKKTPEKEKAPEKEKTPEKKKTPEKEKATDKKSAEKEMEKEKAAEKKKAPEKEQEKKKPAEKEKEKKMTPEKEKEPEKKKIAEKEKTLEKGKSSEKAKTQEKKPPEKDKTQEKEKEKAPEKKKASEKEKEKPPEKKKAPEKEKEKAVEKKKTPEKEKAAEKKKTPEKEKEKAPEKRKSSEKGKTQEKEKAAEKGKQSK